MVFEDNQINRSFFYGTDNVTIYFTYFSEFNRPWEGAAYIEAVFITLIFVLSLIGNCFILGYVYKYRKARTVTNYFVCNLAVADVLYISSAPVVATVRITGSWNLGGGMCRVLNYGMFVCSVSMIWTMVAISIDRYLCINYPTSVTKRLGTVHVAVISVSIWLLSVCSFLPLTFYHHVQEIKLGHEKVRFCTLIWPSGDVQYSVLFTSLLLVFGYGLPVSVIGYNYFSIFKKFWSSKRAIATVSRQVSQSARGYKGRRKRDVRVVKTLVLLVVIFVFMWLPLVVVFSMIRDDIENKRNKVPSYGLTWALIITYLNPCINPFLYGFMNGTFVRTATPCCKGHIRSNEETTVTRFNHHDNQTSTANI